MSLVGLHKVIGWGECKPSQWWPISSAEFLVDLAVDEGRGSWAWPSGLCLIFRRYFTGSFSPLLFPGSIFLHYALLQWGLCLVLILHRWSWPTMDWALWNQEPKQTFAPQVFGHSKNKTKQQKQKRKAVKYSILNFQIQDLPPNFFLVFNHFSQLSEASEFGGNKYARYLNLTGELNV